MELSIPLNFEGIFCPQQIIVGYTIFFDLRSALSLKYSKLQTTSRVSYDANYLDITGASKQRRGQKKKISIYYSSFNLVDT